MEGLGCWASGPDQHSHPPLTPAPASVTSSAVMSTAIMATLLLFKHQKVGDRVVGAGGEGVPVFLFISYIVHPPHPRVCSCHSSWGSSHG